MRWAIQDAVLAVHYIYLAAVARCASVGCRPVDEVVGLPVEYRGIVPSPCVHEMICRPAVACHSVEIRVAHPYAVVVGREGGFAAVGLLPMQSVSAPCVEQMLGRRGEVSHQIHAVGQLVDVCRGGRRRCGAGACEHKCACEYLFRFHRYFMSVLNLCVNLRK